MTLFLLKSKKKPFVYAPEKYSLNQWIKEGLTFTEGNLDLSNIVCWLAGWLATYFITDNIYFETN